MCQAAVVHLSENASKSQRNEHVENSLRQPCDLVFRTAVLRCSILHRESAARNPEICRRGQVHGCRKADVTQALSDQAVVFCLTCSDTTKIGFLMTRFLFDIIATIIKMAKNTAAYKDMEYLTSCLY